MHLWTLRWAMFITQTLHMIVVLIWLVTLGLGSVDHGETWTWTHYTHHLITSRLHTKHRYASHMQTHKYALRNTEKRHPQQTTAKPHWDLLSIHRTMKLHSPYADPLPLQLHPTTSSSFIGDTALHPGTNGFKSQTAHSQCHCPGCIICHKRKERWDKREKKGQERMIKIPNIPGGKW